MGLCFGLTQDRRVSALTPVSWMFSSPECSKMVRPFLDMLESMSGKNAALGILIGVWCVPACLAAASLRITQERVRQGGIVSVLLESHEPLQQPVCEWLGHTYRLFRAPGGYRAALPVDRLQKPGQASLIVRTAERAEPLGSRTLTIIPFNTGPVEIVHLTPEAMALQKDPRLDADSKRMHDLLTTESAERRWNVAFHPPTNRPGRNFGKKRRYIEILSNGKRGSSFDGYHRGLDFPLLPGTSVKAANTGKVLAAEPFVLSGNTVLIDHGQGVITGYFHLQEITVKPGETVARGDVVGLVGSTGRSTGPHLHWSAYLYSKSVSPMALTRLPKWFLRLP